MVRICVPTINGAAFFAADAGFPAVRVLALPNLGIHNGLLVNLGQKLD
jgi:hypothetical protein